MFGLLEKVYISTSTTPTVIKIAREVDYDKGSPPRESRNTLITWSPEVSWQMQTVLSPILRNLDQTNMTPWCFTTSQLTLRSHDHKRTRDNLKSYISTSTRPSTRLIATRLGKLVSIGEGLPTMKSCELLLTWLHVANKSKLFLLPKLL